MKGGSPYFNKSKGLSTHMIDEMGYLSKKSLSSFLRNGNPYIKKNELDLEHSIDQSQSCERHDRHLQSQL